MENFRMTKNIVCILLIALSSSYGFAGSVLKKKKKKRIIVVDMGSADGLSKKAKVCFKSKSGKKVACGRAVKVKKTSAYIRVKNKKRFKKIEKGSEAYLAGKKSKSSKGGKSGGKFMAVRLQLQPAFISPTVFNTFAYVPAAAATTETLWLVENQRSSTISSSFGSVVNSLGAEAELLGLGIAMGARFRQFQPFEGDADFSSDATSAAKYVEFSLTNSLYGVYVDYYILQPSPKYGGIRLGAGLDIDLSTVSFRMVQKEDGVGGETELYNAASSLTVISLRVPTSYEYPLADGLGVTAGLTLLLPVVGDAPEVSGGATDATLTAVYPGGADAQQADLISAMGHTKNSFGLEAILGAYYSF